MMEPRGTILRLQEADGRAATATVRFPRTAIKSATLCSGVEDLEPLKVQANSLGVSLHSNEVVTLRVQ
jgi:hypothetical protein